LGAAASTFAAVVRSASNASRWTPVQLAARRADGGEQDRHLQQAEGQVRDEAAERGKAVRRTAAEAGCKQPPVHPGRRAHRRVDPMSDPGEITNEY
jgi:hypothetical protein